MEQLTALAQALKLSAASLVLRISPVRKPAFFICIVFAIFKVYSAGPEHSFKAVLGIVLAIRKTSLQIQV